MWVTLIITDKYNFKWLEREKGKKKKHTTEDRLLASPAY